MLKEFDLMPWASRITFDPLVEANDNSALAGMAGFNWCKP